MKAKPIYIDVCAFDKLVHLQPIAELWDFYLTNDGTAENFDVSATSWTTDTDPGAPVVLETFDCAVFSVNEDTWGCDEKIVYWVKKGAEIKSDGVSLYWDIMKSDGALGPNKWEICPTTNFSTSCDPGLGICVLDYDQDIPAAAWGFIWYAKYGGPIQSQCGNCSFSASDDYFKPTRTIRCDTDGKWHYK